MTILHIDFESYSACDLKTAGLANYAADPSTGVHCLAYAFDDEPVQVMDSHCFWTPFNDDIHARVIEHVEAGGLVYAHNVAFELAIWNSVMVEHYEWPELKPEQCRCTMNMAYAMALPGALENAAPALGIAQRKDAAGKRIMLQLCKPKPDGTFWRYEDDPAKFEALYSYCKTDVEVERALHARLRELDPSEQRLWNLDYKINNHGLLVDLLAIDKAIALVASEKKRLDAEMLRTTGGVVGSCTEVQLLVKWIRAQGVEVKGVAKADVLDALDGDLPANVRRALELRKEAAKSSTAKLIAMKERASKDGRVRGCHQFHGASTGRWAGRGIQVQNFPRPRPTTKAADVEKMIALFSKPDQLDMLYGPTMDALADCLRGMIAAPPGKELIAVDFSAIEARVAAWLAGQESVLEIFRTHGKIYEHAAAGIYNCKIEDIGKHDPRRQVGKVAILALGYGGGVGAFQSMAKNYNVRISDDEAEQIKQAWRATNPSITSYWYALEAAAMDAVTEGGIHSVGPVGRQVHFKKDGSFLWCKLPSGRLLCYPYPEIRTVTTPWGSERDALTFMSVVASGQKLKAIPDANESGTWKRVSTFGGSVFENLVQAVARDLLAEALLRFDQHGATITAHVHDELVIEIDQNAGPDVLKKCEALMAEVPAWAPGLPLAAEGWRGPRYRK